METNGKDYFDIVGKRMPYRTPDRYFEQSGKQLRAATGKRHVTNSRRLWYGIAASIALIAGVYSIINQINSSAITTPIYSPTTTNTTEEWSDFAEADIFLENMDW